MKKKGFFAAGRLAVRGNFAKKLVVPLVLAATLGVTGCKTPMTDDNEQQQQGQGSTQTVANIGFEHIDPTWTQDQVTNKIKAYASSLSSQSTAIQSQYKDIETRLQAQIDSSGATEDLTAKIKFASDVKDIESKLLDAYQYGISEGITYAEGARVALVKKITPFIENTSTRSQFSFTSLAYKQATYIKAREHFASDAERDSLYFGFADILTNIYGIPTDSIDNTLRVLQSSLEDNLFPEAVAVAEGSKNLIQQWQDNAEFAGYVDDLRALGYEIK
jgi:hypothetical protein